MKNSLTCSVPAVLVLVVLLGPARLVGQDTAETPPLPDEPGSASRIYFGDGMPATFEDVLAAASEADVLFLGETHTDRIAHAVQLDIFSALTESTVSEARSEGDGRPIVLAMEMFETDVQYVLDEYLAGLIREDHFQNGTRPWEHYETDYRPLVELARERGIPVVAANAPRRYVNRVTREGPDSLAELPAGAKAFLPPLPYEGPSPAYLSELEAIFSSMDDDASDDSEVDADSEPDCGSSESAEHRGQEAGHTAEANEHDPDVDAEDEGASTDSGSTMGCGVYAQALWDAGMAWSIASALQRYPGALVVHLTGSFHVRNGTGTPEQLARYRPGASTVTVVMQPVRDVATFSNELSGSGDFVIQTDSTWTRPSSVPES